jgi:hypothetical protein
MYPNERNEKHAHHVMLMQVGMPTDGHNNLNYCKPQFFHSLLTHFPLFLFLQNTQQHPHLERDKQIGPCGLTSIVNFKALS